MNTRTKIYVILLVWGAAILQLMVNETVNREEVLVDQVLSEGVETIQNSSLKAFGLYSNEKIAEGTKETIVKRVANYLGVNTGYTIVVSAEEDGATISKTTRLSKKGEQGDTEVKLITVYNQDSYKQETIEQYLFVEIDLHSRASSSTTAVKKQLCDIYEDLGMEPSINMHMTSEKTGRLTQEEMDAEIDLLFDELNANSVSYDEFQDTIIAYGYSKDLDDYVYQGKEKVNVQIAFSYDEKNDITIMHTAVPFIDGTF